MEQDSLEKHMRMYAEEKPLLAYEQCTKAFAERDGLEGYMRVHAGERQFSC